MSFRTLIDAETLARRLGDPSYAVVDCRSRLDDPSWGEREYLAGHIPGAVFASLDRDLSGSQTGVNGRHPLPDIDVFKRTLGRFGIDDRVQVVAYDQDAGMYASRLWWLLRWLGHDAVAVLDGGWARWIAEARPVASGHESRTPREFRGAPRPDFFVTAEEVAARSSDPAWRLVDARAPERYRGDIETIDRIAGHIPNAINHPFKENVDDRAAFRPAGDLRRQLLSVIGNVPIDHVVCYCGSGVTACHNLLALEHAGLPGAKLYPGSWSEWSSDPGRSVAVGEAGSTRKK
jgi:thiosulfate/3-mercaptopyruvate sulfurtransferase